jgi:hypothetical protein
MMGALHPRIQPGIRFCISKFAEPARRRLPGGDGYSFAARELPPAGGVAKIAHWGE